MKKLLTIIIIAFSLSIAYGAKKQAKNFTLNKKGCCSRHGGAVKCVDGKVFCKDNSVSKSCTCTMKSSMKTPKKKKNKKS